MDLLRVALGYHRGSIKMAKRFSEEAKKRIVEIDKSRLQPYFVKILQSVSTILDQKNFDRTADDALMYSTLCRNYAKKYL